MEKKIIVSKRFRTDAIRIHQHLIQKFSAQTGLTFLNKIEERVELLSKYPAIGKLSQKKSNVRSVTLTPHNLLFYRATDNKIELLCLFDTRRDPLSRPY